MQQICKFQNLWELVQLFSCMNEDSDNRPVRNIQFTGEFSDWQRFIRFLTFWIRRPKEWDKLIVPVSLTIVEWFENSQNHSNLQKFSLKVHLSTSFWRSSPFILENFIFRRVFVEKWSRGRQSQLGMRKFRQNKWLFFLEHSLFLRTLDQRYMKN